MSNLARAQETLRLLQPSLRVHHEMLQDVRKLQEIDRAIKEASRCSAQYIEDDITQKISAALQKEKNEELLVKARYKTMMEMEDDLKHLRHYLTSAETTKKLVEQLKEEDVEIDRRTELAVQMGKQIRAEAEEFEEREKRKDLESALQRKKLGEQLRLQMAEKDEKRMQKLKDRMQDDLEMKEMVESFKKREQQERQANELRKQREREEVLRTLQQRAELKKQQTVDSANFALLQLELQRKRDELDQRMKDARKKKIENRLRVGEKIGQQILAANYAKTQRIDDLIESLYLGHECEMKKRYEDKQKELIENRKWMQASMLLHLQEEKKRQEEKLTQPKELAKNRLTPTHIDSELDILRKRMERERLEIEQYLKGKAMDRADLKAESSPGYDFEDRQAKYYAEVEALRVKILEEQPISVLRYLPSSLLRANYLPQHLLNRVQEQIQKDPIPVFNIKRQQYHIKRIKHVGGEPVVCCQSNPRPKRISNVFL